MYMYKKKLMAFCYGACILLIIAYAFGFRKTIIAKRGLIQLREKAEVISHSEVIRKELVLKIATLDNQLGTIQITDNDQEYVLSTIHNSKDKKNVRIIEILGTFTEIKNGISRSTYGATLEGSFTDLLKTIRTFETSASNGEIESLKFFRYTDTKSKISSTRLKFYIQEFNVL